jgi:hypothetical protein
MNSPKARWLALGVLTGAGALTSVMTAGLASADDVALITGGADVLGGTTSTGPSPEFMTDVYNLYIDPTQAPLPFDGQTVFPGYAATPLDLPALDSGLFTGAQIDEATSELNSAITQTYAGDHMVASSYSESTTPATLEMIALDGEQGQAGVPNPDNLSFVMLGDLNNPNGGIFERLSGLNPGTDYFTATPADTPYQTDIYTIQYDGVADAPQYPSDLPADLNALAGYGTAHLDYPALTPAQLATAVLEPTSAGYYTDGGVTDYYMIPTQDLPMLDLVRDVPGIGNAMADLIQPDLRVLVDMGYNYSGDANVPTQASFLFPNYDLTNIFNDLNLGMSQGITAAEVDLGMLPSSDLPDAYPYLPYVPGDTTVPNPDLIATGSTSSVDPLQSLFSGLDASSFSADLSGLSTDLSTALSNLAPDLAGIGLDPGMLTSFLGF